jgi:flagellar basal body-associated protein FliL
MNIIIVIVLVLIIVAAIVCFLISKTSNQDSSAENFKYDTSRQHRSSINYNVKSTNFGSESKPNATYNINDVKLPISEASNASLNNKTNTSTIGVVSSIDNEISDLEKQLNSVKIISDQIPEAY